jgi:hypothetical protein
MWWRRLLVLALGGVLLSLASCQAADPGQMDLVFRWPDGAPTWSAETPYSLWGRIERWPGGEPAGAVLVGEATGPSGKTYAVLGESAEGLTFAQVPYGDHLVVVAGAGSGSVRRRGVRDELPGALHVGDPPGMPHRGHSDLVEAGFPLHRPP